MDERSRPAYRKDLDLAACAASVALYPLALLLPPGSPLRLAAVLPLLLVVPGYLLMASVEPAPAQGSKGRHAALALGLSPAVVGIAALATVTFPGGFTAGNLLLAQIVAILVLAVAALGRRGWTRRRLRRLADASAGPAAGRGRSPQGVPAAQEPR